MNHEEEAKRLAYVNHTEEDTAVSDDEDNADDYDWCTSVRSQSGLETALAIDYPSAPCTFHLSTCMDESQIAPMFDGTQWAGTRIWPAAVECLEYVLENSDELLPQKEDSTVLELGCGLGLPGMLLQLLRGCTVVLTDKAELVQQMRGNLNQEAFERRSIQAKALDWSAPGVDELLADAEMPSNFDLVINCDCVYVPLYGESYKGLIETQLALLRKNPKTILITSVERRRVDGIEKYIEGLESSDLVDRVEQVLSKGKIEIYRVYAR